MPLGSALKSTIDIDFTRAQGVNSSGHITFEPPRMRIGTTMISPFPIVVPIIHGVAKIDLVRLPAGTYFVRESIDGRARHEFNFALPINSPDTIQYEEIAAVNPVPLVYTAVRTINGLPPDPITGDIAVTVEGSISLDALSDVVVASPTSGQVIVYDAVDSRWENRLLSATDVGASPTVHTHPHNHTTEDITDFETATETIAEIAAEIEAANRALPNRVVRIKDKTKQGAGDTYNLPNTANAWALFSGGPAECSIQASIGDDISLYYDFMMDLHITAFFDFVVVTGGTPSIQRYLASGSATPTFNGPSGSYPSNERFQGINGMLGFAVEAGDLDSGLVRLRWAIKTTADTGKIFANNNYPLTIRVVNTRLSGL